MDDGEVVTIGEFEFKGPEDRGFVSVCPGSSAWHAAGLEGKLLGLHVYQVQFHLCTCPPWPLASELLRSAS